MRVKDIFAALGNEGVKLITETAFGNDGAKQMPDFPYRDTSLGNEGAKQMTDFPHKLYTTGYLPEPLIN